MADVLVCSALDPSGGTGLIADIRVISELGARPCGVVTALAVQNTTGIASIHPSDPEVLGNQLAFLLTDIEVKAVKIGPIGSIDIARALAGALELSAARVVWDLAMYPSGTGGRLSSELLDDIMQILRPHLTLVTASTRQVSAAAALELGARLECRVLAADLDPALLGASSALSSAIAAHLAHGRDLDEACTLATSYVTALASTPVAPGRGAASVR